MPTAGRRLRAAQALALTAICAGTALAQQQAPPIARFFEATDADDGRVARALGEITGSWRHGYAAIFTVTVGVVVSSPVLAALPSRNGLEVIWTRSI